MKQPAMQSVVIDFGPPTTQAVHRAQAFWDRLYEEQRAAKSPAAKQAASEKIWNAATRRTGPGEEWPFPDSQYDKPATDAPKPCAPGSWDAPVPPKPVLRQGDPEPFPKDTWTAAPAPTPVDKPNVPPPRDEWVAAPVAKLKW